MITRYVLAIDPSGNYTEGKGTTGWCLFDRETKKIAKYGVIKASKFNSLYEYWDAHLELLDGLVGYTYTLVLEDYLLYASRADSQINSRFETPRLIGVLEFEAFKRGIQVFKQTASSVKQRWNEDILVKKNILRQEGKLYYMSNTKDTVALADHTRDAIKHAIHFVLLNKHGKEDNNVRFK